MTQDEAVEALQTLLDFCEHGKYRTQDDEFDEEWFFSDVEELLSNN